MPSYSVWLTSHTYGASNVFQTMIATFPLLASEGNKLTKKLIFQQKNTYFFVFPPNFMTFKRKNNKISLAKYF